MVKAALPHSSLTVSLYFSLIATNIAYLWDVSNLVQMSESLVNVGDDFVVTKGMCLLWTFGATCHSIYDLVVWNVMACACCHPGGRWGDTSYARRVKDCGSYVMIPVVLTLVGIALIAVMKRASGTGDGTSYGGDDAVGDANSGFVNSILWNDIEGVQSFSFLSKYAIELSLTWFVYFPICGTIVFSGILGCGGRLPVLGGRPRDMKLYEQSMAKDGENMYACF